MLPKCLLHIPEPEHRPSRRRHRKPHLSAVSSPPSVRCTMSSHSAPTADQFGVSQLSMSVAKSCPSASRGSVATGYSVHPSLSQSAGFDASHVADRRDTSRRADASPPAHYSHTHAHTHAPHRSPAAATALRETRTSWSSRSARVHRLYP